MKKKLQKNSALLTTSYFLLFTILCGCQNRQLYKETRVLMGTFVEVVSPHRSAGDIAFAEIKRIEDLLSKYRQESEISRLNKQGRFQVSPDTFFVLKKSRDFWRLSRGAFDITVGPLMDLWGFRDKKYSLPKEERIRQAMRYVGLNKIGLHDENKVIEFKVPGMQLDLGAIAKGYAVDCAIRKIKKQGMTSCLINAGGDIYCLGDKFGRPWRVAIQNPKGGSFPGYLELRDRAVATSGNYEQFFIQGKKRYSHILDPRTGYPADSGIASVTVIAPDCLTADALATAVFVLGKEGSQELLKNFPDAKVEIIAQKDV